MSLKIASKEDISSWAQCKDYEFVSPDGELCVKLRQLNARELQKMQAFMKENGKTMTRPILIVLSVINEEGKRQFGDDDVDFIEKNFSVAKLREIGECIEVHNGMTDAPVEDEAKNSFATLS